MCVFGYYNETFNVDRRSKLFDWKSNQHTTRCNVRQFCIREPDILNELEKFLSLFWEISRIFSLYFILFFRWALIPLNYFPRQNLQTLLIQ